MEIRRDGLQNMPHNWVQARHTPLLHKLLAADAVKGKKFLGNVPQPQDGTQGRPWVEQLPGSPLLNPLGTAISLIMSLQHC
jgi:hypothetical protein